MTDRDSIKIRARSTHCASALFEVLDNEKENLDTRVRAKLEAAIDALRELNKEVDHANPNLTNAGIY